MSNPNHTNKSGTHQQNPAKPHHRANTTPRHATKIALLTTIPRHATKIALLTTGLILTMAGCSNQPESTTPTLQLTTTTTTNPPITTSTTQATTTTQDPNLALIEEIYRGHFAYLPTYGAVVNEDELARYTADPLLTRRRDRLAQYEAAGFQLGQSAYEINIIAIEIVLKEATVLSCNLDATSLLDEDGGVVIPADEVRYLRLTTLQLLTNGWRVTDTGFLDETKTPCDA